MTGIVYIFDNPAMPGFVKIGKTSKDNVEERLKALSNPAGVPMPFECLYAAEVADATKVEEALHEAFAVDRPNKKREFFKTAPERIITLLKAHAISDATPSTRKMIDEFTSPEDKLAQKEAVEVKKEEVDRLKAKGWQGLVEGIGLKNPEYKNLGDQLRSIAPTKGNVSELRKIIEEAPTKSLHSLRRTALIELLEEIG